MQRTKRLAVVLTPAEKDMLVEMADTEGELSQGALVRRLIRDTDFLRLSEGPEMRALVYDSRFRLLGAGEHCAALVVGLPVEVMAYRERGLTALRGLRGWMFGRHVFTVNGAMVELTIAEVQAMAQTAGT